MAERIGAPADQKEDVERHKPQRRRAVRDACKIHDLEPPATDDGASTDACAAHHILERSARRPSLHARTAIVFSPGEVNHFLLYINELLTLARSLLISIRPESFFNPGRIKRTL